MSYLQKTNLFFRRLEKQDLENTFKWMHLPMIYDKIGVDIPFSKTQQESWFESLENNKTKIVFAVCIKESGLHIGNVSLDFIDLKNRNARFSIFIAEENSRGKGLGSECIEILKKYCFDYMNLIKIYCKTDTHDKKVVDFYLKNGFVVEGVLKKHEYKFGKYVDKTMLACFS